MDIPFIVEGAQLPALALLVSMALANAVAATDDDGMPVIPDASGRTSRRWDLDQGRLANPARRYAWPLSMAHSRG